MRRKIFIAVFTIPFLFIIGAISSSAIQAIELEGNEYSSTRNETVYSIIARPDENGTYTTAQLSIDVGDHLIITGYIPPLDASWYPPIIVCNYNELYQGSELCLDLDKIEGTISDGESLGLLFVQGTSSGVSEITGYGDNGYIVNNDFDQHAGLLFETIVLDVDLTDLGLPTAGGALPTTSILTDSTGLLFSGASLLLLAFGWMTVNKMGMIDQFYLWVNKRSSREYMKDVMSTIDKKNKNLKKS